MNIGFVEPHLQVYGGIRRVLEFANRFVARGESVTVYHPAGTACDWMKCEANVEPLPKLFDRDHDVVIFNNPPDYKRVRRCRARVKVFYILALYDRDRLKRFDPKIFWPRKGRMLSLRRALQLPFVKVSNATWMQRWLREELGIDSHLQLGGINREVFRPRPRREKDGCFVVLASGDPRRHKGFETVAAAIERVRASHPGVTLETYHGQGLPQSAMARVYSRADLFVDAQWYAGWNNPVAEAMACGTPVVCTDIGGVADFAFHERTALLVPTRDAGALAGAIERMVSSPDLRNKLSQNALQQISRFDWDQSAAQFLEFLYDRAGTGPQGTAT